MVLAGATVTFKEEDGLFDDRNFKPALQYEGDEDVVDDALRVRPDGALAEAAGALLGDPDGLVDPIPLHSPDGVVVTGVVVEPEGLVFTGTLDPVVLSR